MMVITHAPHDLVVGTSDGVDVRFAGVELKDAPGYVGVGSGRPSIQFCLSGVRGEETSSRDLRYERELGEWGGRHKAAGSDSTERPPSMPGVAVFEQVTTRISDDVGTDYQRAGGQVAGGGTEWDARWTYTPAPPPRRLKPFASSSASMENQPGNTVRLAS